MRVISFLLGLVLRILLIPVWIILALSWLIAMTVVRIGCVAKGLASSVTARMYKYWRYERRSY